MYTGKYFGFGMIDEGIFSIFLLFISYRITEITREMQYHTKKIEMNKSLELINRLLQFKIVEQLAMHVQEVLPEYLKYQNCNLLWYKAQNDKGELYAYAREKFVEDDKSIIKCLPNAGLSGHVFTNDQVIYQNGKRLEKDFFHLDNPLLLSKVNSYAFIPVYGNTKKVIGILQLYNKITGSITVDDIKTLTPFQHILGAILENTLGMNEALDYMLITKCTIGKILKLIDPSDNNEKLVLVFI
jgi:hypothetical protein